MIEVFEQIYLFITNRPNDQASIYFGVNKKSLLHRTSGEIPVNAHVGRQTAISMHHEDEIAECIKLLLLAGWGWGFSSQEVTNSVRDFTRELTIDRSTPFVDGNPGDDWLYS